MVKLNLETNAMTYKPLTQITQTCYMIAGFGFRHNADLSSFQNALAQAENTNAISFSQTPSPNLPPQHITLLAIATAQDKITHQGFMGFCQSLGLLPTAVSLTKLRALETPSRPLKKMQRYGDISIAEASALGAAQLFLALPPKKQPSAFIQQFAAFKRDYGVMKRVISTDKMVTCALWGYMPCDLCKVGHTNQRKAFFSKAAPNKEPQE